MRTDVGVVAQGLSGRGSWSGRRMRSPECCIVGAPSAADGSCDAPPLHSWPDRGCPTSGGSTRLEGTKLPT